MVTSSFTKRYMINDKKVDDKLHDSMKTLHSVKVKCRDLKVESKKGIELLKQSLSN